MLRVIMASLLLHGGGGMALSEECDIMSPYDAAPDLGPRKIVVRMCVCVCVCVCRVRCLLCAWPAFARSSSMHRSFSLSHIEYMETIS